MADSQIHVALAGNPNCGKTTLFNLITGANGYVGNWPGVTVEKKEAKLLSDKNVTITDLLASTRFPTALRSSARAITS